MSENKKTSEKRDSSKKTSVKKEDKSSKASTTTTSKNSDRGKKTSATSTERAKSKLLRRKLNLETWKKRAIVCYTLIAVAILVVIFGFCLNYLATPVSIILWIVIIVFLLRGIVSFLEKHNVNRVLGTAIAYLVMFAIIGLIFFFMFSPAFGLGDQIKNIVDEFPKYVDTLKGWALDLYSQYSSILDNKMVREWIDTAISNIGGIGSDVAAASAGGIIAAGGAIGSSFMALGIALVIAFWILIDLPKLGREVNRFVRPKYREDVDMWHYIFTHVMAGYIKGTFLQCFIIGFASGILFWILQIPNAAAFGTITGVLNIIPIVGPWIGGLVACLGGLFSNPLAALIALAGTIAIQQFVYTFISPKIMANSVDIHPALTLFALVVGGAIGGAMSGLMGSLVGMLISIPAVAVFKSLFVYYYEKKTKRRIIAVDGVFFKGAAVGDSTAKPKIDAISPSPGVLKEAFSSPKATRRFARKWKLNAEAMADLEELAKRSKYRKQHEKEKKDSKKDTKKQREKK